EAALLVLADGMGGVESGEVAGAIAGQTVRKVLRAEPPFAGVDQHATPSARGPASEKLLNAAVEGLASHPDEGSTADPPAPLGWPGWLMVDTTARGSPLRGVESQQERIASSIREANRQVHAAASHGLGNRGMGCTLEVVLVDGSMAVFGHVGDSRAYHLSA